MKSPDKIKEYLPFTEQLDRENLGKVLYAFEQNLADNLPGTIPEQRDWINQQQELYKELQRLQQNTEKGYAVSEKRLARLKETGIDPETFSPQAARVLVQFFETLRSVAAYLDEAAVEDWPRKKRDQEIPSFSLMRRGAEANIKFINFFIRAQKLLELPDEALEELYRELFSRRGWASLRTELEIVGLDEFPRGILAAIRAYTFLKTRLPEHTNLHVPDVTEDLLWGVDLISETRDESGKTVAKNLYQIKGRAGETADIFDLSDDSQKKRLLKLIETLPEWDQQKHISTMERLIAYRDRLQKENPDTQIKAYWVEVIIPLEEFATNNR